MANPVLLDTGPLVASLNRREPQHSWAGAQLEAFGEPMLTCEAVLSEAFFLLRDAPRGPALLVSLIEREVLQVAFDFGDEKEAVMRLMRRYASVPMSFADACLVRMSEMQHRARVFTLDHDFTIYRRNGRERIPLISPW